MGATSSEILHVLKVKFPLQNNQRRLLLLSWFSKFSGGGPPPPPPPSRLGTVIYYLRRFSESRSSSGSTPSVRPSVRPFVCPSVRLSATLLGSQVCVICNSKSFHSFLFKLCILIIHTLKMCTSHFMHI